MDTYRTFQFIIHRENIPLKGSNIQGKYTKILNLREEIQEKKAKWNTCFESDYLWKSKFPCRHQVGMNRDEDIQVQEKDKTLLWIP